VKIARELAASAKGRGKKLYVMDEPTTGLHLEDVRKLAEVFARLVAQGHTLLLIEHNLDVVKLADWVIDVGPEAGDRGGEIVAMGRPEAIMAEPRSHTGHYLRRVLAQPVPAPEDGPTPAAPATSTARPKPAPKAPKGAAPAKPRKRASAG
jgi:excinuclease ABC subunit A